jgi:hypothetical protein
VNTGPFNGRISNAQIESGRGNCHEKTLALAEKDRDVCAQQYRGCGAPQAAAKGLGCRRAKQCG